jgi:23S rRNA (uracil1939-C5)-methyltransferase
VGEELVVALTSVDRSGAATARVGDERILVHGAIPGERVRVRRVRELAPGRTLAELVSVLEPSPYRVAPRCRHASVCGGCTWQHVAYEEQLRLKVRAVESVLRRALGDGAPPVGPMVPTPAGEDGMPWGYRQKSSFVFAPGGHGGGLAMGHYARGTHDVVPVVECPVHPERANRIAFALRDALAAARVEGAAGDLRGRGLVRHVVLRTTRDERESVAMLVVGRDAPSIEAPLRALLSSRDAPDGLAVNLNDRPGPYLVGRQTRRVHGPGHVREESIGPVSFLVSPTAFFQTNVAAAGVLVDLVTRACEEAGRGPLRVLDLYSGSGLFSLPLAARGHAVVAVEASRKGARDAALNRRANGLPEDRLTLVAAEVERALPRLVEGERFDAVVLDPPREGCPPPVLRSVLGRLRPARVVIVSCNPEALGRELAQAFASGWRALPVQPVDMFPHTPHVEAVAVLLREEHPSREGPSGVRVASRPGGPPTRRTPSSRSRTPGSRRRRAPGRSRTP